MPEFRAKYISTDRNNAGKNYKIFLGFLASYLKSGLPTGKLEFTFPELESEREAQREKLRELRRRVKRIPRMLSSGHIWLIESECKEIDALILNCLGVQK